MSAIRTRAPGWFNAVAVLLLLWGLMGCFAWVQQMRLGAEAMGPASDYDRALYASLPAWYNAVYGVAVVAGLLGAAALLMRSRQAGPLFALSLAAVVVQFGYAFLATDLVAVKGAGATLPFPILVAAVAGGAWWLSRRAAARGWIG